MCRSVSHAHCIRQVAYGERPAFEPLKTDAARAMMDRRLFEAAPLSVQLNCVREEVMRSGICRWTLSHAARR
jgi:hypothetical protein